MSFGFSPGDLVMLINGFYRLTGILRNSPGQYQNLLGTFNNFCILSKRLDLIPSAGQASDEALKGLQQQTYDVLKTFFSRIKKFDRYLGKGQDPFALRNVVHKINWASQVGDLNDLLKDLERLVIFINVHLTIDMRMRFSSTPCFMTPQIEDQITFVDANLRIYSLDLVGIPSWEALHEFLLQRWPVNERGAQSIIKREYLIHNATTRKDFIPSSPCAKPFTDMVTARQRLEMSVIFSYEGQDIQRCPRSACRKELIISASGAACECSFQIEIRRSSGDHPDPLTSLALGDIVNSGVKEFIRDFDAKIEQLALVSEVPSNRRSRAPRMGDFLNVVLCFVQWAPRKRFLIVKRAERSLERAMQTVGRTLHRIRTRSLEPLEYVATLTRWHDGPAGYIPRYEEALEAFCTYYDQRHGHEMSSKQISRVLVLLNACSQESNHPFHPLVLTARCYLWIYSRILTLETILLAGVAILIREINDSLVLPSSPIFERILGFAFIPHALAFRLTLGVISDTARALSPPEPQYWLAGFCQILVRSRSLSTKYLADGNLSGYDLDLTPRCFFQYSALTSQSVLDTWLYEYRQSLESLLGKVMAHFQQLFAGKIGGETDFDEAINEFWASL